MSNKNILTKLGVSFKNFSKLIIAPLFSPKTHVKCTFLQSSSGSMTTCALLSLFSFTPVKPQLKFYNEKALFSQESIVGLPTLYKAECLLYDTCKRSK